MEIERKFLVIAAPPLSNTQVLYQGYLVLGQHELRIRRVSGKYKLTAKFLVNHGALEREEYEQDVMTPIGDLLYDLAPYTVSKIRNTLGRWEIDHYLAPHRGLVLAEVELRHRDEPLPELPFGLVLGAEVTDDLRYRNQWLAKNGMP